MNMMSNTETGFADLLKNGRPCRSSAQIIERTKATGCYNGLEKLELRESDPIGYEKLFSKLRGGLVHARETAKKIAASPIVEQEGELCFTLYNAVGDCVLTSTGIIIHVGTMGAAIKYMIENNWEANPGIAPVTCSPTTTAPSATSTPATSRPSFRSSTKASDRLGGWCDARDRHRCCDAGFDVDGPDLAFRRRLHDHLPQDRCE
jgi:hypothetical protein